MVDNQENIEELDTQVNYDTDTPKKEMSFNETPKKEMDLNVTPKEEMDLNETPYQRITNKLKRNNANSRNGSITKSPNSKRIRGAVVTVENEIEVPEGWRRQIIQRQGGLSAGKCDVYYFSPLGKKLRSKNEVQAYCELNDIKVDLGMFSFTHSAGKIRKSKLSVTPVPKKNKTWKSSKTKIKLEAPSPKIGFKGNKAEVKKKKLSTLKTPLKISDGLLKKRMKSVWVPPKSPFSLFQETLFQNPWKLLLGTIFLSRSTGDDAMKNDLFWNFLKRWSTPEATMKADWKNVAEFLKPLTGSEKLARTIIRFSEEFATKNWTYPKELYGIGKYGNDSYRIFCINEWKKVKPTDFLLIFYVDWLWDNYKVLGLD